MKKETKSKNRITRREFLQSAALGLGALGASPIIRALSRTNYFEEIDVISGYIDGIGQSWVDIKQFDSIKRIYFDHNSYFWKGGDTNSDSISVGDDIVARVRVHDNLLVLKLWDNLTRVRGIVKEIINDFYIIKPNKYYLEGDIPISFNINTLLGNPLIDDTPSKKNITELLSIDDDIDVIGEKTNEGILASTIIQRPSSSKLEDIGVLTSGFQKSKYSKVNGLYPDVDYVYTGHVNWFDCPTGAGGCGTCNTSNAYQTAYPSIDVNGCRGRCASDCCDCARNCLDMLFLNCGDPVYVIDKCYDKSRLVNIVDCGPYVTIYCSQGCGVPDCENLSPPVIDLTKPTFTYFRDPDAGWGCFSCDAIVAYK